MKQLEIQKYLFDINEACELLIQFTAGKTFSHYSADPMLRSVIDLPLPEPKPKGAEWIDVYR